MAFRNGLGSHTHLFPWFTSKSAPLGIYTEALKDALLPCGCLWQKVVWGLDQRWIYGESMQARKWLYEHHMWKVRRYMHVKECLELNKYPHEGRGSLTETAVLPVLMLAGAWLHNKWEHKHPHQILAVHTEKSIHVLHPGVAAWGRACCSPANLLSAGPNLCRGVRGATGAEPLLRPSVSVPRMWEMQGESSQACSWTVTKHLLF